MNGGERPSEISEELRKAIGWSQDTEPGSKLVEDPDEARELAEIEREEREKAIQYPEAAAHHERRADEESDMKRQYDLLRRFRRDGVINQAHDALKKQLHERWEATMDAMDSGSEEWKKLSVAYGDAQAMEQTAKRFVDHDKKIQVAKKRGELPTMREKTAARLEIMQSQLSAMKAAENKGSLNDLQHAKMNQLREDLHNESELMGIIDEELGGQVGQDSEGRE